MFDQLSLNEVEKKLNTDLRQGLSEKEVTRRRKEKGQNVLAQPKKKSVFTMFAEQLNNPLIFILLVAAGLSMAMREMSDAAIILVVIVINGVVGVVQEGKAQRALEALKEMTSPTAIVKREGIYKEIPAADLVIGDVVELETGCQVPADLRLTSSFSLKAEESALTGESLPVQKDAGVVTGEKLSLGDRKNMVFMSTSIVYGRGEGVVTAAGMNTEIGKIAGMLSDGPQEPTPLQRRLGDIGNILSACAVILCIALFVIAVIQRRNIPEMLITAISLAVAAVPEGLPAIVTIVLALSVSRMVRVNTIVRRLPAVETLGSVNVVCSDKTGTLTQNKMKVVRCYTNETQCSVEKLNSLENREFLEGFVLCNDALVSGGVSMGDPTEIALMEMGAIWGISKKKLEEKSPRVDELPFDSKRKMMTTVHQNDGQRLSYTKGSSDVLVNHCTRILKRGQVLPITGEDRRRIESATEEMSSQALRVLGLAMRPEAASAEENNLVFVGLAGMMDPPREEAADAISVFKQSGVKTVMITGDHVETAFAIAKQLGIANSMKACITGEELEQMSDAQLEQHCEELSVFARVSPQHKVRIVKAFRSRGNVVAMTGDGVNDAPSLKSADIGIAMGKCGTDVAKNAADIVLTDDNFATIERAIEEGRGVYENIKKSVLFLLSSNFGEIITMFLAVIAGLSSPLKASHILWVNLITDSLPALALGVDENDRKLLMQKPPRSAKESLFAGGGLFCTLFYGCLIATVSLIAFFSVPYVHLNGQGMAITLENLKLALSQNEILMRAQTYAFTVLGISELFHAVGMRNVEKSFFLNHPLSNKMMIAAFFIGLGLQISVTEIPYFNVIFETVHLSVGEWLNLIFLSSMPLFAHEMFLLDPTSWLQKLHKGKDNEKKTTEPGEI
ncbi:MAG TPA: cation-translocating P-type ATPase [Candidatus Pelethocola excrementipullorum]|nr:cation-translocating P-type ATPase [Candidatus Pelethocola excrementipullorum]